MNILSYMTKNTTIGAATAAIAVAAVVATVNFLNLFTSPGGQLLTIINPALAAKFDELSQNGNSSCSATFKDSISAMSDANRLEGSCCSPMDIHRYSEQVEGLKKYVAIKEIPPDPYDIDAGLAKKMMAHYDDQLTAPEQTAYDYAMANSKEKGPCCYKCWRWYVYGGLGKYLIKTYRFTGEQVTEVWNLSDGCGSPGGVNHS